MSITIVTPAESTGLTTAAAVKSVLGVSSSKFDAELNRLVDAATAAIESYVGHVYAKQTYEEVVAGKSHPLLMLTNTPIIGLPVILVEGSPVVDFEVRDADAGVLYRQVGWASAAWIGWYSEPVERPGTEDLNYAVTYEAGYIVPGLPDSTLPKNIEQACIETIVAWYRAASRDPAVKSKKVGDLAITYKDESESSPSTASAGLPPMARALLSRRVV